MHMCLQEAKVVATMIGHTDRVNCVQWLPTLGEIYKPTNVSLQCRIGNQHQLVHPTGAGADAPGVVASGAADNNVIIWLSHPDKPDRPWSIASKLQVHLVSHTCIPYMPVVVEPARTKTL